VRLLLKKPDLLERETWAIRQQSDRAEGRHCHRRRRDVACSRQRLYGVTPPLLVVPLGRPT